MKTKHLVPLLILFLSIVLGASTLFAGARSWELDKAHGNIYFSVDHIFSKIRGKFEDFTLALNFDPADLAGSSFLFTIEVESINTGIPKRDKHLLSEDFFDAAKFPQIVFESTSITDAGDSLYEVAGTLTIKGKTYDLTLPFKLEGVKEHPAKKGTEVAGFNGSIMFDRLAHGVGNGKFYEMGIVGKDVDIFVSLEVLAEQ
ncbi:MAG: YceI family protein [Desulfofustis sp.]|jgi:polyisoprenoid-binding protein YceI|nr:YceI family protein [Desulfofustis sp.]